MGHALQPRSASGPITLKAHSTLRKLHHWSAPLILLPLGLTICTGVLLLLKKEFDWIQPPTQRGVHPEQVPAQTLDELFRKARQVPALELEHWADLARVDVKPGKGVIKFVAANRWEAQLDAHTGEVLQVAYRRSDLIEALHDGSFFTAWSKLYVFLPAALVLLFLWASGIYLFVVTQAARQRKARRLQKNRNPPVTQTGY